MIKAFHTDYILDTQEFSLFHQRAVSFCALIECFEGDNISFLRHLLSYLNILYCAALELPWVKLESNIEYEDKLDGDRLEKTLKSVSERLSNTRYYWYFFNPIKSDDNERCLGDLADDIGDIYRDLKYDLLIFNLGKPNCKENALWQFKFGFDKHWGDHCMNALYAIHYFLQENEEPLEW